MKDQTLEDFIKLYEEEFGITLTEEEALPLAFRLVNLFKAVYKAVP